MIVQTAPGIPMNAEVLKNYFRTLINMFFKILPLWEKKEPTLIEYMKSFQAELLGCKELVIAIREDAAFLSLISILQHLIDTPDCDVRAVKSEVFKAISICNRLKAEYLVFAENEQSDVEVGKL